MSWLEFLLVVVVNGLVDCTLVAYISGKQSKKAIIDALQNPDEETKYAVASVAGLILTSRYRTGRKVKDDEGNEHDEEVSFLNFMGRELSQHLLLKLRASKGGTNSQAGAALSEAAAADPFLASMMGIKSGPRKGQSMPDYLIEQLSMRLMPVVEQKITEKLNTVGVATNP